MSTDRRILHLRATSDRTAPGLDAASLFALIAAAPFLLPVIGVQLGDVAFAVPLAMLIFATARCVAAASHGDRLMWLLLAAATALGAASSALAIVTGVVETAQTLPFYLGGAASVAIVLAFARLGQQTLTGRAMTERTIDGVLVALVVLAVGVYLILIPGFADGDAVLTGIFAIDLVGLVTVSIAAVAERRSGRRRLAWCLAAGWLAATVGDALVSGSAAGQFGSTGSMTAALWAIAGFGIALATDWAGDPGEERIRQASGRWLALRVFVPLVVVLAFPAAALVLWLEGSLRIWSGVGLAVFFLAALVLASSRQAYLLVEHHRATLRERGLRKEAQRRNVELEALTGLATTMIETLDEAPIVEQGLSVLHLAAKASSASLHLKLDEGLTMVATAGGWDDDREWVHAVSRLDPHWNLERRAGRLIARLPMHPRGERIGVVTLVRKGAADFDDSEVALLRLLVDQLGVAVQNARDYRDKLEQAIRDPLTGLYNRRFFYEALGKEMRRHERYESAASLVLFDVDDFKGINDTLGHAAGDEALRRIAEIANELIRPSDSLARVGGEEFALLLPETGQLDALLVAERIRTSVGRSEILDGRRVTLSGGVGTCPQDATGEKELEKKADDALYWAKRNGKNLCAVASEVSVEENQAGEAGAIAHLYALVATIDAQQLQTRDHSENVALYATAIAQSLELDRERVVKLRRAALLHDLGKIAVRAEILNKPGPLTEAEAAEMRTHSMVGAVMAHHAGLLDESEWILQHHERLDGQGYPRGREGDEIPLEARIIFVADAFEAMTSDRPYRRGMEVPDALEELRACAGTQFDPEIVDVLTALVQGDRLAVLSLHG